MMKKMLWTLSLAAIIVFRLSIFHHGTGTLLPKKVEIKPAEPKRRRASAKASQEKKGVTILTAQSRPPILQFPPPSLPIWLRSEMLTNSKTGEWDFSRFVCFCFASKAH
jgi:hypothetical protein